MPDEPDPPPRKAFVRDYSAFWTLPPPPRPILSPVVIFLLAALAALIVLALISPLIRLARDFSAARFA
jgi:hypothetical protein